ncbi:MAG TPA: T9SS type A sorting domain-containing protein [Bacteroidota bacterium]|nr:T9SS type A sorting domain-containing protein [Bacteroidota bacterium]
MKHVYRLCISAIFVLLACSNIFAQSSHELFLPAPTTTTYLNQIIYGDTTATGKRKDTARVYVLERGGIWFYNGPINNLGWDLNIRAAEGTGKLPIIYGVVAAGGKSVPNIFIQAGSNVSVKNLLIDTYLDIDPDYYKNYGYANETIAITTAGNYNITVDGCVFVNGGSATLRIDAAIRSVIVTNSVFANNGQPPKLSTGNGRVIDMRGSSIDTCLMVNNTMINTCDRIVRRLASTTRMNNFIFEHNTILNNGGRYGVISLSLVGNKVQISNNLFVDPMSYGADSSLKRQNDWIEAGESYNMNANNVANYPIGSIGDAGRVNMAWIYSQKEATPYATKWNVKNNYYYITPELEAAWAKVRALNNNTGNPTLNAGSPLTNFISSQLADPTKAFIKSAVTFKNAPKDMSAQAYWCLSPGPTGCGENSSGGTAFADFDKHTGVYYRDTLDCSYATTLAAYTGGVDGYPVGDLNWFPAKKTAWQTAGGWATGVAAESMTPREFSLGQNYPNPFNPSTQISFTLKASGMTTLKVYNVIGQEVASLVNGIETAGQHEVSFDASRLSSGVYFYTLRSGNFIETKKMMLMK